MKRKILIVENSLRVQREIREALALRYNHKYMLMENGYARIYLTGELEIAEKLIQQHIFDSYFFDNEINSKHTNSKVLAQDRLISMVLERDLLSPFEHPIYDLSSHSNESEMNKYITNRCEKSGNVILKMIDNIF